MSSNDSDTESTNTTVEETVEIEPGRIRSVNRSYIFEESDDSRPTKQMWHILDSGATVGAALSNNARHLRDMHHCEKVFRDPSREYMWSTLK